VYQVHVAFVVQAVGYTVDDSIGIRT